MWEIAEGARFASRAEFLEGKDQFLARGSETDHMLTLALALALARTADKQGVINNIDYRLLYEHGVGEQFREEGGPERERLVVWDPFVQFLIYERMIHYFKIGWSHMRGEWIMRHTVSHCPGSGGFRRAA